MSKPLKATKRLIAEAVVSRFISGNDRAFYKTIGEDYSERDIENFLYKYTKQIDLLLNAIYPYVIGRAKV